MLMKNLSYLKDCPIAVLGAGAVGMTLAADCKLGQPEREVRLYSRSPCSIAYMDRTGIQMDGIQRNLYAFERSGRARLDMYTTDLAKAVGGGKINTYIHSCAGSRGIFEKARASIGGWNGNTHLSG